MEGDIATWSHSNEDLAALALGGALMIPAMEGFANGKDDDILPSGFAIGVGTFGNGRFL